MLIDFSDVVNIKVLLLLLNEENKHKMNFKIILLLLT
jgi:hypothetical protein